MLQAFKRALIGDDRFYLQEQQKADLATPPSPALVQYRLLNAVVNEWPLTARYALEKGARADFKLISEADDSMYWPSAAFCAAHHKGTATAAAIFARSDLNAKDWTNKSALQHARERGHGEMVQMLLEYGADPFSRGPAANDPRFLNPSL